MSGARIEIEAEALDRAIRQLNALTGIGFHDDLLARIGAVGEAAVRRRIAEEKRAPDGTPWAPWSDRHGETRHAGQSILLAEGDLLDSIAFEVNAGGTAVEVGSNLVYAAIHQFGGAELPSGSPAHNIPARPYLGLSDSDEAEIVGVIQDYIAEVVR